MKRISLLLTCLVLFCGWLRAQTDKISFNETEHDFGTIGEKDGNATFDFVLTNNSDVPILITNAVASCGCTKPFWTKEPIEPGKKGTISVAYNPLGRVAPFTKTIAVYANMNGQSTTLYLKIKGTVVNEKKKPEDDYPVALGNYLLKTKELNFGKTGLKDSKTIRLEVYNNSDQPITQKAIKLPKYLTVGFNPVVIPAKTAGIMDVTLSVLETGLYGNLSGNFTLLLNETPQSLPYSVTVLDDFSQWSATQKANAGKIAATSEIKVGNSSSGSSHTLKISNSGKSTLNIRSIQSSDPLITVSKSKFSINPGEIAEIKVNIAGKKVKSTSAPKLTIISDDPNTPMYEINVLATDTNS